MEDSYLCVSVIYISMQYSKIATSKVTLNNGAKEHHAINADTALMIASWQVVFTLIQKTHKVPNVLASRIRYHDSTSSNYAVNANVFIFCSADYYHLLDVFLKGILWSVLFTCSVTHQNAQP